jgi:hypothetical protein
VIVHKAFNCAGEKKLRALGIGDNGKDGGPFGRIDGKSRLHGGKIQRHYGKGTRMASVV